ncbi:hypothetical protein BCR35DRAFT_298711 [Leucosporidium creatinivorum]|uniref:Uncharacterized protein n=1 Tax=Leucosporidium creatinivorum TaxID=106004 RepID=A0A1Y2G2C1_9BASI|nr:hypothetical protein BCR35DRAFT_298711 [Leucosporidium creatinivorum]
MPARMKQRATWAPPGSTSSASAPFTTYEDPHSLQEEFSAMPSRPGKLARSISRPFSDVRNYLRVSLHKERGIDSEKAKALNEQRRRSGGVGPSCFDEVAATEEEVVHAPIASTSHSTLPSPTEETPGFIPEPSSAGGHSDPYSSLGLSGKRPEWDSLLPSPSSPDTSLPSSPDESAPSPPLRTPPRPSSAELSASPDGQARWKGKARAQHPVLVETCPTPPSSAKYRPGSRQRSIMNPSGLGIDVAEFDYDAYGPEEEDEDRVETLEEDDPNDWDPYTRRPSGEFTLPLSSSASASALPFPSDLVVESLLSSQPSTSSFASPHSSPRRYRTPNHQPRDRDFTPPLAHLRPVRKSEILASPALSNRRPTAQELRAKASNSTLFSWDLAHLPAPNTPREKPFKVGLRSLLMPSFALGGGKGSGKYGDAFGPVERQVASPVTGERAETVRSIGGGLGRTLSSRTAKVRRSIGAWSMRSRKEETAPKEELEDWVALVIAE